jgi:hypothetical protein
VFPVRYGLNIYYLKEITPLKYLREREVDSRRVDNSESVSHFSQDFSLLSTLPLSTSPLSLRRL